MNREKYVGIEEMEQFLQQFLEMNFVTSVSFSYTEVDEMAGIGIGTRTTIEKNRYEVNGI